MRKGTRFTIGRYSGGVVFNALTLALSLRREGTNGKPLPNGEGIKGKPPSGDGDDMKMRRCLGRD